MALTEMQERFVAAYLGEARGNATEAARIAGYGRPEKAGYRVRQSAAVRARIDTYLRENALAAEEVLRALSDIATAEISEFLKVDDDSGSATVDLRAAKKHGKLGLIQKIRVGKNGELVLELYNRMQALELLGRYHRLFAQRLEHSGPGGGAIRVGISFEEALHALRDPEGDADADDAGATEGVQAGS